MYLGIAFLWHSPPGVSDGGLQNRNEFSSVYLCHPHPSGHEQSIPVTGSVLVVMTLVWLPSRFVSSLHVFVFSGCMSLSSHIPRQERMPVIEPFSPPDLTPECPVRTPSVGRYTHAFIFYVIIVVGFFFLFLHLFLSSWCVLMCCNWVFKIKVTFAMSVSEVSKGKVRSRSRISAWSLCWAEDTLARYPVIIIIIIIISPYTLYEKAYCYCMSARRCCCRSTRRRERCMPSKPWRKGT